MDIPSIGEMKNNAADTAGECPGCGWSPEGKHISHQESHGEDYLSVRCYNCREWQYEHHGREWIKLTPPGEENPTVSRSG